MESDERQPEEHHEGDCGGRNKTRWADFENEVKTAAEGNGITFVEDVDTAAFQEACQSIYDGLKTSNAEVYAIVEKIQAAGR